MAPSGPLLLVLLVPLAAARAGPYFRPGRGCRLPLRGDQLSGLERRWAAGGPAPRGTPGDPAASPGLQEPGALPPLTFEGQIGPLCRGALSLSTFAGLDQPGLGLWGVAGGEVWLCIWGCPASFTWGGVLPWSWAHRVPRSSPALVLGEGVGTDCVGADLSAGPTPGRTSTCPRPTCPRAGTGAT